MAIVRSVNVGTPRESPWAGIGSTAFDKVAVCGPVACRRLGLAGDQVADTRHHGGPDQAVYAFDRAELDWWGVELGADLRDGEFGENLTLDGLIAGSHAPDDAEVGERWRIGSVLLEVRSIRTPCNDFKLWMGRGGHDNRAWVRRFTQHSRPGPYLRVLEEGELSAGDVVELVHRPGHGVTVATMFAALNGRSELLPQLLAVPDLLPKAQAKAEEYLARSAGADRAVTAGSRAR